MSRTERASHKAETIRLRKELEALAREADHYRTRYHELMADRARTLAAPVASRYEAHVRYDAPLDAHRIEVRPTVFAVSIATVCSHLVPRASLDDFCLHIGRQVGEAVALETAKKFRKALSPS